MSRVLKVLLAAASSLLDAPAHAQLLDQEIVVTATRAPARAETLPADVQVIDVDAAREQGRVTLDAALSDVPGMQAMRAGPLGQQASLFSGGLESNHTLVLFDGIRLDDPSTPESIFDAGQDLLGDADRIEVVQGPMSALYGSGALGGVVNILPRRGGLGRFNSRLEVAAGSFESLLGTASIDGTLGTLRYALTADAFDSEGYDIVPERMATHTGERDGAALATLTGAFDLVLSPSWSLDLLLRERRAQADYDPGLFGNVAENPQAEIVRNDTSLWRLGAVWAASSTLSLRLSGGQLRSDRVTADAGVVGDQYRGERVFADLAATWSAGSWTGAFGIQLEEEEIRASSFGLPVNGEQTHSGAYATLHGEFDALHLTAAVRNDDVDGSGQTTWRGGVSYAIAANSRIFAAYGASFRAPSLYERHVPIFGAADLDSETGVTWELGGETVIATFGRQDGFEIAALYRSSRIRDLIGFSGLTYANVDRAQIDFVQASVTLRPLSWLEAGASYAATDARDERSGLPLPRRPRHSWSGVVKVQHGRLETQLSWRDVGARYDIVYDDLGSFSGTGRVVSYDILGASTSWRLSDRLRVYIAAENLLDRSYEPVNGFAGPPRNVLVGIRVTP